MTHTYYLIEAKISMDVRDKQKKGEIITLLVLESFPVHFFFFPFQCRKVRPQRFRLCRSQIIKLTMKRTLLLSLLGLHFMYKMNVGHN